MSNNELKTSMKQAENKYLDGKNHNYDWIKKRKSDAYIEFYPYMWHKKPILPNEQPSYPINSFSLNNYGKIDDDGNITLSLEIAHDIKRSFKIVMNHKAFIELRRSVNNYVVDI